jgi:hypothetical protein
MRLLFFYAGIVLAILAALFFVGPALIWLLPIAIAAVTGQPWE